jgi:hypothetical protein
MLPIAGAGGGPNDVVASRPAISSIDSPSRCHWSAADRIPAKTAGAVVAPSSAPVRR